MQWNVVDTVWLIQFVPLFSGMNPDLFALPFPQQTLPVTQQLLPSLDSSIKHSSQVLI
jgi:hypothetical protein